MTVPAAPQQIFRPSRGQNSWRYAKVLVGALAVALPSLKVANHYSQSKGRGLGTVTYVYKSQEFLQYEMYTDNTNNQYAMDRLDAQRHAITSNATFACLSDDCMKTTGYALARAFPDRTDHGEWCLEESGSHKDGLILVKVPKAASSTAAGVALRIADRHKCRAIQWQHRPGRSYKKRKPQSFLFTSVRDPSSRIMSYLFFMEVSIQDKEYSDEWMLDRLKHFSGRYGSIEEGQGGFTMQFAALDDIPKFSAWSPDARESVQNPNEVQRQVQSIVDGYDFMLVVDRMDESLVALSLLLDIDVGDVLVTSSKVAGSYFYNPPKNECVEVTKSFVSPAVQAYLDSNDWKAQNYGDYLLHAAASRSLDLTIDRLGRHRFDAAMERYNLLKAREKEVCAPDVEFPCSKSGRPQPKKARKQCYQRDFGCGYKCIDDMIAEEFPLSSPLPSTETDLAVETMEYSSFA